MFQFRELPGLNSDAGTPTKRKEIMYSIIVINAIVCLLSVVNLVIAFTLLGAWRTTRNNDNSATTIHGTGVSVKAIDNKDIGREETEELVDCSVYPSPLMCDAGSDKGNRMVAIPDLPPVRDNIQWAWNESSHRKGKIVVVPKIEMSDCLVYFIGDLHGDWQSLQKILNFVVKGKESREAKIVFMGDLIDRSSGEDSLVCARMLCDFAISHPNSLLWLGGNHDVLVKDREGGWHSLVEPCEFSEFLNRRPDLREEGKILSKIMEDLPVGLLIGDVWCSHGGVLQDDILGIKSFNGFASMTNEMYEDLVWGRMRDVLSRRASRAHHGIEVGRAQAKEFVRRVAESEGVAIRHFVCAHQHEAKEGFGYLPFEKHFSIDPTCQCICSFRNREAPDGTALPAILRYDGHSTPVPILFK